MDMTIRSIERQGLMLDTLLPSLPTLLVLRALEEGPAHGYRISRWIEQQSEGVLALKEGTLYPVLHQLEKKGLLLGRWHSPGTERPTKVYELTDAGRTLLSRERQTWKHRAAAVERMLSTGEAGHGLA